MRAAVEGYALGELPREAPPVETRPRLSRRVIAHSRGGSCGGQLGQTGWMEVMGQADRVLKILVTV